MKKFLSLPAEKQDKMVTAAMTLFGEVGYKKAYISEIASAAGISKALVFHYFGTKRALYSYLVYYTGKIVMTEEQDKREVTGKGFFERALVTLRFRLTIMKKYPAMSLFIQSVYKEDDPEVAGDIERLLAIATDMHAPIDLLASDAAIFKAGVDPAIVASLVSKYIEGVISTCDSSLSIESVISDAAVCLSFLNMQLCMK